MYIKKLKYLVTLPIGFLVTSLPFTDYLEEKSILTVISLLALLSILIVFSMVKRVRLVTLAEISSGIVLGLAVYTIIFLTFKLIQEIKLDLENLKLLNEPYLSIFVAIAMGFIVESYWRGLIQETLMSSLKPEYSWLVTSALYSSSYILAMDVTVLLVYLVVGITLGLFYAWYGSLPMVMLAHVTVVELLILVGIGS